MTHLARPRATDICRDVQVVDVHEQPPESSHVHQGSAPIYGTEAFQRLYLD